MVQPIYIELTGFPYEKNTIPKYAIRVKRGEQPIHTIEVDYQQLKEFSDHLGSHNNDTVHIPFPAISALSSFNKLTPAQVDEKATQMNQVFSDTLNIFILIS